MYNDLNCENQHNATIEKRKRAKNALEIEHSEAEEQYFPLNATSALFEHLTFMQI